MTKQQEDRLKKVIAEKKCLLKRLDKLHRTMNVIIREVQRA